MIAYDDTLKVKDALQVYFSRYHFADGGYHLKWFKVKFRFFYVPFPNVKSRVDAVKMHDIHHLITGYEANLKGEAEISGWELASGCGRYYAAWVLNAATFFYGIFFNTRKMYRAFLRGRRARTNCYYNTAYDEVLLNTTLGDLRKRVNRVEDRKNSLLDSFLFVAWAIGITSLVASLFCVVYFLISLLWS